MCSVLEQEYRVQGASDSQRHLPGLSGVLDGESGDDVHRADERSGRGFL